MLLAYGEAMPEVGEPVFIAPGSYVIGQVKLAARVSVWFNAVLRGDSDEIQVGESTNLQDLVMVHVDPGVPVQIGSFVTVGHRAIIHGATIGNEVLVGMGAVIMNGARIGDRAMIGAGAVVAPGMEVPPGHLAVGVPARVVRPLTTAELASLRPMAERYCDRWQAPGWRFR